MGPEDPESLPVGRGEADGEAGGAVGDILNEVSRWMRHAEVTQRRLEVRVAQVGQAIANLPAGRDGDKTPLHVVVMLLYIARPLLSGPGAIDAQTPVRSPGPGTRP